MTGCYIKGACSFADECLWCLWNPCATAAPNLDPNGEIMSNISSIDSSRTNAAAQVLQQAAANRANQKLQARTSSTNPTEEKTESSAERTTETESGEGRSLNLTA